MIAKKFRFHGHVSIKKVYRQGRVVRNKLGSLHAEPLEADKASKVAVVVSKKVNKSAVARNRIRRRIFEIVRQDKRYESTPTNLVFTIYLSEAEVLDAKSLKGLVDELLSKSF